MVCFYAFNKNVLRNDCANASSESAMGCTLRSLRCGRLWSWVAGLWYNRDTKCWAQAWGEQLAMDQVLQTGCFQRRFKISSVAFTFNFVTRIKKRDHPNFLSKWTERKHFKFLSWNIELFHYAIYGDGGEGQNWNFTMKPDTSWNTVANAFWWHYKKKIIIHF